jgi:hypothetical protein
MNNFTTQTQTVIYIAGAISVLESCAFVSHPILVILIWIACLAAVLIAAITDGTPPINPNPKSMTEVEKKKPATPSQASSLPITTIGFEVYLHSSKLLQYPTHPPTHLLQQKLNKL